MVSSGPCRRFISAMAARAAEPGALDSNQHALGNVAWGLAVAQQLTAPLLQQVRLAQGTVMLCECGGLLLRSMHISSRSQLRPAWCSVKHRHAHVCKPVCLLCSTHVTPECRECAKASLGHMP